MYAKIILPLAFLLAGCASAPRFVYVVPQLTAPVQIVKVIPGGENLLAYVTVRNNTDRYVQDFTITWTVFRPVGCARNGPAPRIGDVMMTSVQAYAEQRGTGTLAPGATWGSRVLLPHEETKISTPLFLSEDSLRELAEKYNAKKLRVQIGVATADFTEGNQVQQPQRAARLERASIPADSGSRPSRRSSAGVHVMRRCPGGGMADAEDLKSSQLVPLFSALCESRRRSSPRENR